MSRTATGWAFVAIQAGLLIALVLIDGRDDWPTPPAVHVVGLVFVVGGAVVMGVAALRLGPALTPTPVPNQRGELTTTGLYRYVRHPIYTGVLAVVAGLTIGSGSLVHLAIAIGTFVFFDRKARWEEARLAETYELYPSYAATTPRFVPFSRRPKRAQP